MFDDTRITYGFGSNSESTPGRRDRTVGVGKNVRGRMRKSRRMEILLMTAVLEKVIENRDWWRPHCDEMKWIGIFLALKA